jgi:hypothetical protein
MQILCELAKEWYSTAVMCRNVTGKQYLNRLLPAGNCLQCRRTRQGLFQQVLAVYVVRVLEER